jgi:uncharacterized protein (TIGR02118 family)
MIKRLTTWQVKAGLSEDEAVEYWLTRHVPLVLAVPGVQAYVQNRCIPGPQGNAPPYSGLGEVWFESPESAARATESPEWSSVIADAGKFMDLSTVVVAWAEEHPASKQKRGIT